MAGILVKGIHSYDYDKAVRGSSFIRLYDEKGFCFRSFLDIDINGFSKYTNYELATQDTSKTYYIRSGESGSYTFTETTTFSEGVYEILDLTNIEPAKVAGAGTVTADVGSLIDSRLELTLPAGIYAQSGLIVNFKTPVDNTSVNYVIIENVEYELVDATNTYINNYKNAFAAESIVSITLDLENHKAVVNNLKFSSKVKVTNEAPDDEEDFEIWINPNGAGVDIDYTVTEGSENLITSGAVFEAMKNVTVSGGTGGSDVDVDTTLTVSGAAADAKTVGDRIANLATQSYVNSKVTGLATETFVTNKISEAQLSGDGNIDLSGYATKDELNEKIDKTQIDTTLTVSGKVADAKAVGDRITNSINGLASEDYVDGKVTGLATEDYVDGKVTGLATQTYVNNKVSGLATESFVTNKISEAQLSGDGNIDLSGYATKDELNGLVTEEEFNTGLSGKANSSHTHSSYVNQNAFGKVTVGTSTITADNTTDTLTLVAGNNVTITPDTTNDSVTISATDTVYTHPTTAGNKHIPSGGSSGQILRWSSSGTATWGNENTSTYTLGSFGVTATANELNVLDGITATTTELNYVDGVTSNIQTQLNGKASSSHGTHVTYGTSSPSAAGTASAGSASSVSRSDHVHPAQTSVTGNAGTATALANTRYIDGVSFTGDANVTRYATCSTTAGTAAKTASITAGTFNLTTGARVSVKFTYANTASSPTLKIGSTTAKSILWRGSALASTQYWAAGQVVDFVYDGTYWNMIGAANDNDTTSSTNLSSLGITATAAELNYVDGVTSNIQTQLNGKAASYHGTHVTYGTSSPSAAGTASAGSATSVSRSDHVHPAQTTITGNAGTATTLANTRYIDGVSFTGSANVTRFGTSSTSAATAAKTVSITAGTFSLITGARVTVKFSNANTAASPTLNVGSTGAKTIRWRGATLTSDQYWAAGQVVDFVYDGTYWNMIGAANDNNTVGSTTTLSSLGITATAAELNKMDGVTATTAELNYVDGVTSNIQTQLNGKASSSHTHSEYAPSSHTHNSYLPTTGGTVTGTLYINNTTDASPTANNNTALIIGNRTGEHLAIDGNEIIPKSSATAGGTLYLGDGSGTTTHISSIFKLSSPSFGTSLPAAGNAGRIFFKKV